ncbi:acetylglutamate kinase [Aureivirga sp. CE67]|uniref:acetylglutamate kinase n=1 Tax=Aureivirga sp. CE67 TaxID=1788983 RepID=UPI0018C9DFE6|nr:acetylglutamate kinase [Aureivirga sp. CE67]
MELKIVKIGGNIINNEVLLDTFLQDFSAIDEPKILIHGGGNIATKMNESLGYETKMFQGRRITSEENLEVVTMTYAGLINKKIVAKLQSFGCNSLGLSGADGKSVLSKKREKTPIDFGWVGDVEQINSDLISVLLEQKITPVFCAISYDANGFLLNTNADTIASEIAIGMNEKYESELYYCFEKKGVLKNVEDENSFFKTLDKKTFQDLKNKQIIHNGMLPKLENCFQALEQNVQKVCVGNIDLVKFNSNEFTSIIL